jgi:hypothetical protein
LAAEDLERRVLVSERNNFPTDRIAEGCEVRLT